MRSLSTTGVSLVLLSILFAGTSFAQDGNQANASQLLEKAQQAIAVVVVDSLAFMGMQLASTRRR